MPDPKWSSGDRGSGGARGGGRFQDAGIKALSGARGGFARHQSQ